MRAQAVSPLARKGNPSDHLGVKGSHPDPIGGGASGQFETVEIRPGWART